MLIPQHIGDWLLINEQRVFDNQRRLVHENSPFRHRDDVDRLHVARDAPEADPGVLVICPRVHVIERAFTCCIWAA